MLHACMQKEEEDRGSTRSHVQGSRLLYMHAQVDSLPGLLSAPAPLRCLRLIGRGEFDFSCGRLPLSLGCASFAGLDSLCLRTDYNATLYFPAVLRLTSLELYAVTLGMVFEDAHAFCERLADLCVVYEMRIDGGPQRLAAPLAERGLALASAQLKGREQTVAVFIRGCSFDDRAWFDHYRGRERKCGCGRCWECLHARSESRLAGAKLQC